MRILQQYLRKQFFCNQARHHPRRQYHFTNTDLEKVLFTFGGLSSYHHSLFTSRLLGSIRIMSSQPDGKEEPRTLASPPRVKPEEEGSKKRQGDKDNQYGRNSGKKKARSIKNDGKKSRLGRAGFDENRDDRDIPANPGSYANEEQRKVLGLVDVKKNLIKFPDDAKILKKKVALLLAFIGKEYSGFQVNPKQKTLQGEIELALYRAGMLSEINFGNPFKYSWSNSARTDKGVHACAQVCSMKVEVLESDLEDSFRSARQRLQERLPGDIQVLDIVRTTKNFCAKTQRERVRYQYMVPAFLLHPNYRQLLIDSGIPTEGRRGKAKEPLLPEEMVKLRQVLLPYRSSLELRKLFQEALKKYEGTKPFHNFTKGMKPGEPQALRYIESFTVQEPVIMNGMEWIPTQVLGQSFLLHQIRKMICMAVDVARGAIPLGVIDKALQKEDVVIISLAPPQGLFLELSFFETYNRRKSAQNPDLPDVDFLSKDGRERWESFRAKIWDHIGKEELEEGNFLVYMYQQECLFDYRHTQIEVVNEGDEAEKMDGQ